MNGMLIISHDGNTWCAARKQERLYVALNWSGRHIAIGDSDSDAISVTLEEAEALLSILPEAIAALKQNSA